MSSKYYFLSILLILIGCSSPISRSTAPGAFDSTNLPNEAAVSDKADCCFSVEINRIIDGDTFEGKVDHSFKIFSTQTFRLWEYEAPERTGKEAKLGKMAKEYLEQLMPKGSKFKVRVYEQDSFGRWLVDVLPVESKSFEGHLHLADLLIDKGYGVLRSNKKRPFFDPNSPYPFR